MCRFRCKSISSNNSFRCSTFQGVAPRISCRVARTSRYRMTSRKITIITSPQAGTMSLPNSLSAASTPTKTTSVYRIEERSRTIYVTGDVDPTQWDTHSLNAIFALAEVPEDGEGQDQPIRRAYSCEDAPQLIVNPESTERSDDSVNGSPRKNLFHSRRLGGARNTNSASSRMSTMPPYFSQQLPPPPPPLPKRILFYHKHNPHYGFTNFSSHSVIYNGKTYPTSEHLFQSFKFLQHRPNLAEHIRTCSERPSVVFSEARRFQPEVRPDWKHVNIEKMEETIFHKFTQHADLRAELLATGDAELVEDSDKDAFWGIGADGRGRNELGKALERLRVKLRGFP